MLRFGSRYRFFWEDTLYDQDSLAEAASYVTTSDDVDVVAFCGSTMGK
jgi:hypothetical protein